MQRASAVATWSVGPVVRRLAPQLATANRLACQGLDHLEQKMPALHQPLEKVTEDLKASVFTGIQNAVCAIGVFLKDLRGAAAKSYEESGDRKEDTAEPVRRSRLSLATEAGLDATMGKLENVIDFFLQKAEEQSAPEPMGSLKEDVATSWFGKVRAFAGAVVQQASDRASHILRQARDTGQGVATWIFGLAAQGPGRRRPLLRTLPQNLRTAYLSALLLVMSAPSLAWSVTGRLFHVSSVRDTEGKPWTFRGLLGQLLGAVARYVPLPAATKREDSTPGLTIDEAESTGEQETGRSDAAALTPDSGGLCRARDARRLSRGHYPLPFLNLDDDAPLPFTSKEGAGRRRWSEGLFWISPEVAHLRARFAGPRSAAFEKE